MNLRPEVALYIEELLADNLKEWAQRTEASRRAYVDACAAGIYNEQYLEQLKRNVTDDEHRHAKAEEAVNNFIFACL